MQQKCIWGHSFCDNTQDPKNAKLESHISAAGSLDKKPEDAFAVDPEPRPNTDLGQVSKDCDAPDACTRAFFSAKVNLTLHLSNMCVLGGRSIRK